MAHLPTNEIALALPEGVEISMRSVKGGWEGTISYQESATATKPDASVVTTRTTIRQTHPSPRSLLNHLLNELIEVWPNLGG